MREAIGIAIDATSIHAVLHDTHAPELGPIDRRSESQITDPGFESVVEAATVMIRRARRVGLEPRITGVVSSDTRIASAMASTLHPHGTGIVTLVGVTDARIAFVQSMPELQGSRTAIVFAAEGDDILALSIDLRTRGVHHAFRYPATYIGSDAAENILDDLAGQLPWGRKTLVSLGLGATLKARLAQLADDRRIEAASPFDPRWALPIGAAIIAADRSTVHVELPEATHRRRTPADGRRARHARHPRANHPPEHDVWSIIRRTG